MENINQTFLVHACTSKTRAITPTITPSAGFGYEDANEAEGIFAGKLNLPLYSRMGNPTNSNLEQAFVALENGFSAISTSSGMGALSMVLGAFLNSGDKIVIAGGFFSGSFTLVTDTLKRFGIKNRHCDVDDYDTLEKELIDAKVLLIESVSNPLLSIADIEELSILCKKYNVLLVVDNTLTPIILKPLELGADIVVYSSTKCICGHSNALGGIVVLREVDDNHILHNKKFQDIHPILQKAKKNTMFAVCKKRALRDMGMSANAFASFLTMIGLETLKLRLDKVNENVNFLLPKLIEKLKDVKVSHASIDKRYNDVYKKYFPNGSGALFTLDFGNKEKAFKFLNALKRTILSANVGDNRTLALHMKSTIFADFSDINATKMGVTEGLVRVSIGIEEAEDILEDFIKAYKKKNNREEPLAVS